MSADNNILLNNLASLSQPDNFQKYVLGYKSNGQPRALYDVVKHCTKPNKKKGKKHRPKPDAYQLYLTTSKKKKKKKKKGKKHNKNYWHISNF